MAEFVAPEFDYDGEMPVDTRERILVAYPHNVPRPGRTMILDSGAFAMSKQKTRVPEQGYIAKLAAWYGANYRPGMLCMAPDVYPDPYATMRRYEQYGSAFGVPLVPVFQGQDLFVVMRQAKFYASYRPSAVAIGNPMLHYCDHIDLLGAQIENIRHFIGRDVHIHCLGAGWTPQEAALYRRVPGLDSFDTIAYYTQTQRPNSYAGNQHWQLPPEAPICPCAACQAGLRDWRYVAMHNAYIYQGGK